MSLYAHRRKTCGHRNYEHRPGQRCGWLTRCPCESPQYGPSEVMPTYNAAGVTPIIPPGDGIRSDASMIFDPDTRKYTCERPGQIIVRSCDCAECQALYASATA